MISWCAIASFVQVRVAIIRAASRTPTSKTASAPTIYAIAEACEHSPVANLVYDCRDDIILAVHNEEPPTNEEWTPYVDFANTREGQRVVLSVVYSDGGGPNAKQRQLMLKARQAERVPSVIISSSIVARGIITALTWLGKSNVTACAPDDLTRLNALTALDRPRLHALLVRIARLKLALLNETLPDDIPFEEATRLVATPLADLRKAVSRAVVA
jgi:hypothetical protein